MPELPEVETTKEGIKPFVLGETIASITVRQPKLRWPVPTNALKRCQHYKIIDVCRRAKYLLLKTDNGSIIIHLGMSGSLRVVDQDTPFDKHDHVELKLQTGKVLRFRDPRRFGAWLIAQDPYSHDLLKNLGPEPLSPDFTGQYLHRAIRTSRRAIKNVIMDHHIVVGVGNIYASESLFMSGILPTRQAAKISLKRCEILVQNIKKILKKAIKSGGTTLRDFQHSSGKPGYFKQKLFVYGRQGEPCFECNQPVKSKVIGQRNSFYCIRCQK